MRSMMKAGALALLMATAAQAAPTTVRILAFNDFHGHIKPFYYAEDGSEIDGFMAMASTIGALRAEVTYSALVSAGDLYGGTPLESAAFADEPTVRLMNLLRPELGVMGNHEFDAGQAELQRKLAGGCVKAGPVAPCQTGPFEGIRFPVISSNILTASGKPLFPASIVRQYGPVRIAYVGATTQETPSVTRPSSVAGLRFLPEAESINQEVKRLQAAEKPDVIVAVMHEGGVIKPDDTDPACPSMTGRLPAILKALDPAVKVVISGHTHRLYTCERDGRLVTSAQSFATYVTRIDLSVDAEQHRLLGWKAEPVRVSTKFGKPSDEIVAAYRKEVAASQPLVSRVVAKMNAPLDLKIDANGESELGKWVADAYVDGLADKGAEIGFTNSGGLRAPLRPKNGELTYGDLFAALPFMNQVVLLDMDGRTLLDLLKNQYAQARTSKLMASSALHYRFGDKGLVEDSVTIGGKPLDPARHYKVATNDFLVTGGDHYAEFTRASVLVADGPVDHLALQALLAKSGCCSAKAARAERVVP